jgi:phosphatidylglycerol lysyltransferase
MSWPFLHRLVGLTGGLPAWLGVRRRLRPPRSETPLPSGADLDRVRPIVERSPSTYAHLALRGDKALLFSTAGDGFLMYGRHWHTWVAMGDPIGPDAGVRELAWRFRDLCARHGARCVFFEVRPERRGLYAELGLELTPLGEEAHVNLRLFSLETPTHKGLRQARSRLVRAGCGFDVVPRADVPAIMPALAHVSDAWLAAKATREKGFSNASFDTRYLVQFPVAVVRRRGEIVAFANLWEGAGKVELSIDLMRHLPEAPNGTMDFLFSELFDWGRNEGYEWFNFGMTPLSGLEAQDGGSLWSRVGTFIYRHGEHFYNFTGLRRYKAKFDPVWTPLFLASPGGLALPAVLVDVTALIAGSLTGIVFKGTAGTMPRR